MDKTEKLIIATGVAVTLLSLYMLAYGEEKELLWEIYVPNLNPLKSEDLYTIVPIYIVDEITICKGKAEAGVRGCYHGMWPQYIEIERGSLHSYAREGCTVYTHEVMHAWGYADWVGPLEAFSCPPDYYAPDYSRPEMQFEVWNKYHVNPFLQEMRDRVLIKQ